MADVDAVEMTYYRELCERLRACRWAHEDRKIFTYKVATEEQILAVEARPGFSLPPLLRMIYLEVADRGYGITDDGYYLQELVASNELNQDECRKGWRLHPRIERALQRHQRCYVLCDAYPEHFLYIGQSSQLSLMLDTDTGWVYDTEFAGVLPKAQRRAC